jgi:hypothetical protein
VGKHFGRVPGKSYCRGGRLNSKVARLKANVRGSKGMNDLRKRVAPALCGRDKGGRRVDATTSKVEGHAPTCSQRGATAPLLHPE